MPPVAKPVPAIASIKAEPVPQTAKSDDGKEFLYATKVSHYHFKPVLPVSTPLPGIFWGVKYHCS